MNSAHIGYLLSLVRRVVCPILARFEPPLMKAVSWGEDFPDKTFLVIRRHEPQAGLCSLILSSLAWIRFAERNGMVPVVDWQTYRNVYQNAGERGRVNAWDSFFDQPGGYTLAAIAHAKRVVVATGIMPVRGFMPGFSSDLAEWRMVARRALRPVEENLSPYASKELEPEGPLDVVGVLARGTDYVSLRPKGHPIQPTAEELIAKVRECANGRRVYLVTEDSSIRNGFSKAFGERLIFARQECVKDYRGGYLSDCGEVKNNRERGLAYFKAILDLSRCSQVVAGRTSGTLVAALLADESQRAYYFDLGCY